MTVMNVIYYRMFGISFWKIKNDMIIDNIQNSEIEIWSSGKSSHWIYAIFLYASM